VVGSRGGVLAGGAGAVGIGLGLGLGLGEECGAEEVREEPRGGLEAVRVVGSGRAENLRDEIEGRRWAGDTREIRGRYEGMRGRWLARPRACDTRSNISDNLGAISVGASATTASQKVLGKYLPTSRSTVAFLLTSRCSSANGPESLIVLSPAEMA